VFPPEKIFVRNLEPRYKKVALRDANGKILKGPDKKTVFEEEMNNTDKKTLLNNLHEQIEDGSFNLYRMEIFNPSSPVQVGRRLMSLGWNPQKFTATGQPATSKDVIGDAIDMLSETTPEVEVLRKYRLVEHRFITAKEWLDLAQEDGKVHGSISHIGPWTHRSAHHEPNMGNISKTMLGKDKKPVLGLEGNFGYDCRSCWVAREGWALVGCDAEGIQLRALAHYMGDPEFIKTVTTGDVHTANMVAAGITRGYDSMSPRDVAKRFIYAWLLGAGDEKVGNIVRVFEDEYESLFERAKNERRYNKFRKHDYAQGKAKLTGKDSLYWFVVDKIRDENRVLDKKTVATILKGYYTKKQFLDNTPALKRFKEEDIASAAAVGYMVGLDGRKIWVPNAHFAMGAYLQGFEAVVMKYAMRMYQQKLKQMGIPFAQTNYVHDEYCVETPKEHAETVGKIIADSIKQAGIDLGSRTPLAGSYHIGTSWGDVH
jgi:DNA polymerase I-like protein with 3'-5' exonuclease and polymerase domains